MVVLQADGATFARGGDTIVPPFSLELASGEHGTLGCVDDRAARVAARVAAGIVKVTSGKLLICHFDPRVQPVQAKRCTGFVPRDGDFGWSPPDRDDATRLHASLFEVSCDEARRRVRATLEALGDDGPFAFALALALVRPIRLLVLDRPPADVDARLAGVVDEATTLLSTRVHAGARAGAELSAV